MTADEAYALGVSDQLSEPPASQALADRIAAILAPHWQQLAREPQAA